MKSLKDKKIFFIDLDGTLVLGDKILPGAVDFLNVLKEKNKIFYVLTNNSSKTAFEHCQNINKGLNLGLENIYVSSQAAAQFLIQNKIQQVYWVANASVSCFLQSEGLIFNETNPQAILLTYDDEITYQKLEKLTRLARAGVPYYATHSDIVCPTREGDVPDIGTFIKIVEMATGVLPDKIFGKPDKNFIEPILRKHKLSFNDAVIIGDRLYTDMKMAENSPITSVLVLTGETTREMYKKSGTYVDIVVQDLSKLKSFI